MTNTVKAVPNLIPPFVKGQSHKVGELRSQGRKHGLSLSPSSSISKLGPSSTIGHVSSIADMEKFYKDLSSSSNSSISDHLSKLKVLFKSSNLTQTLNSKPPRQGNFFNRTLK